MWLVWVALRHLVRAIDKKSCFLNPLRRTRACIGIPDQSRFA